jgi:type IV pilus assembly protein PilW
MNTQLNMQAERGFGLVEIMIALVLSSFLMLGLATMVSNVSGTYNSQSTFAAVNDKERFASTIMHDMITPAGYYSLSMLTQTYLNSSSIPTRMLALPAGGGSNYSYVAGQAVSGATGSSATAPDQLNIRFQANTADPGSPFDCMGNTAAPTGSTGTALATGVYESQLSVDTTKNALVCQIGTNGAAVGSPTILMDGISNMKILYGYDAQNLGYANQYVPASSIAAGNNWLLVRSVQITLTFDPATTKSLSATTLPPFTQTFQMKYSEGSR